MGFDPKSVERGNISGLRRAGKHLSLKTTDGATADYDRAIYNLADALDNLERNPSVEFAQRSVERALARLAEAKDNLEKHGRTAAADRTEVADALVADANKTLQKIKEGI